ncbi:hypothetical protein [Streptomyces cinereospinus]|uniref:Uncharacterized protein n=1 Tax=Streptomyces cinereospinus TaxID=285561 RepID=A0ABV5N3S9_9ACTN
MEQPPTAPADAPANPAVCQALASIEAAKEGADPAVVECLDAVAALVRTHRDPVAVFDSVLAQLAREQLRVLAAAHGLRLYWSTEASVDDGHVTELVLFPGFAILPHGQRPEDSLAQLRAALADRQEEQRLAVAFQARVASGRGGDVREWFAWMRGAR